MCEAKKIRNAPLLMMMTSTDKLEFSSDWTDLTKSAFDPLTFVKRKTSENVLFIGTRFSNLHTSVDTPARGRVGGGVCDFV